MAKKKSTDHSQSHTHKQEAPQPSPPISIDMEDPSAQIQNLKNLNSVLLKETTQHRSHIEALLEAKKALQSQLDYSAMAANLTQARFSEAADQNVAFELEKGVLLVFVETQMREMGFRFKSFVAETNEVERALSETESQVAVLKEEVNDLTLRLENERIQLSTLSKERDQMKNDLDGVVDEVKRLTEKLVETENRERKVREEVEKLRLEGQTLLGEINEKERVIRELDRDKGLALRSSEESAKAIDKLEEEIDGVMREKNEIEKLKNDQELKISGLEMELKELDESLNNSRNEEALMRRKILELEGSLGLAMEKEKDTEEEIRGLVREKKEMEKSVDVLTEKRDSMKKVLEMVQKELVDKQRELDETVRVRDEFQQEKIRNENEIAELYREVDRLRSVEHKLKESCIEFEEKNKHLLSEVNGYRNYVDELMIEKGNIRRELDQERDRAENLMLQVAVMVDKIEQAGAELGQMTSERNKLIERNKMVENQAVVLMVEKDELQRSLLEAQQESNDLRAKYEFSSNSSNQALAMLKNTAALVCQHKEGVEELVSSENHLEEEIKPYAEELVAIRNAFKSKNEMVDDMKQRLESLEKSVDEAHKNKNLLTVISSATTIFAAALAAYVARGR